ncbi:MAG TPA: WD40 repeat domain-containing protein, partial [Pyrinomonadaceae bacterium]
VGDGRLLWKTKTGFIRKGNESSNLKEFYWSADEKFLVTKSTNGTYQTWNAKTGKIVSLDETKPGVKLIAANKKEVSYTKDYSEITFKDAAGGETRKISGFGRNSIFDISNNGEMIAEAGSWGDAAIKITNIKTGKFFWLDGHPSVVGVIAFTPDGKFFAVGGSDKIIYIFDAENRALVKKLTGHARPVNSIAFSPDGKILLSSGYNETIKVWNWQQEKFLQNVKADEDIFGVEKVSFSADGKYFLTSSDRAAFRLWDAKTFRLARSYKTAENYESRSGQLTIGYDAVPVSAVNFSGDGQRIISVHADDSVRIWNVGDGRQIKKIKLCADVSDAVFSRDDKKILAYCEKRDEEQIRLFDAGTGREIFKFDDEETGSIETFSLSLNGKYFATSDVVGDILLWTFDKSKPVREFDIGFSGDDAIAFSPDGKTFVVGGRNQNLFLFDVETGSKIWQLIPSYQPGELEIKLYEEKEKRLAVLNEAKARRDSEAAIETEKYKKQIYLAFEHYGEMQDAGEKRMVESSTPKESLTKKARRDANAVWLRLHNDSPLPVKIPTQSMYLPNGKCFFEFSNGAKIFGLCDDSEISVWHGLKDKQDKWIPFGFDFGSSAILLPQTSVLFPVPLEILKNGNRIVFSFTFQKEFEDGKSGVYGTEKDLSFGEKDLPKTK